MDKGDSESATESTLDSQIQSGQDKTVAVTVVVVEGQEVADMTSFPADLEARRRAVLASEVAGTVEARRVEEGDKVSKGTELISVDTRHLEQRLAEAKAVERQRAIQLDRAKALFERQSITKSQLLNAVTAQEVAAAQLATARLELEKSKIVAPWSGTVSVVHPEVGDFVGPGQSVVELVDTSYLEARATVPSSDVPFLRLGMEAQVLVDVLPGQVFAGKVVRLGAELDPRSRTLDAVIRLPSSVDSVLRPGLAAQVRIARQELSGALLSPLDAVIEMEQGHVVYVAVDATEGVEVEQRPVVLGPVIGEHHVVIEDGLSPGERLVVEGQRRLSPGQNVEVTAETQAGAGEG